MVKTIFLFGHRATHGKDTCCDILEEYLKNNGYSEKDYCRTYFAKLLKKQVADRYNLDFERMNDDEYKRWCPPHIKPRRITITTSNIKESYEDVMNNDYVTYKGKRCEIIGTSTGIEGLFIEIKEPRSVRDILIEEGCKGREIWQDVWANSVYQEIFHSGSKYGLVSDFRFPNEYDCFSTSWYYFDKNKDFNIPRIVKVLVHRKDGKFVSDGADDQLPDIDEKYWDYIIYNNNEENWYNMLKQKVIEVFEKEIENGIY